jgi:hypothetical protein
MVRIRIKITEDLETRECSSRDHRLVKSPYKKELVPEIYFQKGEKGSFYKTCLFCRQKDKDLCQIVVNKEDKDGFRKCGSRSHKSSKSEYPEWIPDKYFLKSNGKDYCKYCSFCREHQKEINKRYNDNKNKKAEEDNKKGNGKYRGCPDTSHKTLSNYSEDKVPIDMFRKEKGDPNSILLKYCSDCRKVSSSNNKARIAKKKEKAEEKGNFYCTNCHKELPLEENAKNLDGSYSIHCHKCKEIGRIRSLEDRDHYKDVKYQKMLKLESSCNRCNCVYIYEDNTLKCLETKERTKGRKLTYNNESYYVSDFLESHKNILEIGILELDHLTEEEQRERGILNEDEEYIPKKKIVAKLSSRSAMDLEARKCQLLCGKCHLIITMDREVGFNYNSKSYEEKSKLEYQRPIKDKGCSMCNYKDPHFPRFFHFDHINPEEKVECVARMTKDKNYSLDDVKKEINKCRVLCMHCHKIHTRDQREKGIVTNQYGTTRKL